MPLVKEEGGTALVGTTNYVAKYTPDGFTLGNSQIFDNGTYVNIQNGNISLGQYTGIPTISAIYMGVSPSGANYVLANTATEQTYLNGSSLFYSVSGSVKGTTNSTYTQFTQAFAIGTNIPSGSNAFIVTGESYLKGIDATSLNFALKVDNSASNPLLYVRNDGNVGVGITIPTSRLHVNLNTTSTGASIFKVSFPLADIFNIDDNYNVNFITNNGVNITGSNGSLNLISNGGTSPSISFKFNNGASTSGVIYGNGLSMGLQTPLFALGSTIFTSSATLHLKGVDATSSNYTLKVDNSASSPLLYVRNDGNVGINNANPSYKLHSIGDVALFGSNNGSFFNFGVSQETFIRAGTTGSKVYINDNGGNVDIATGGGSVGVGTIADAAYKLKVANGNSLFAGQLTVDNYVVTLLGTNTGSSFNFGANQNVYIRGGKTDSDVYMQDNHNGKVGIGTTAPTAKLQVVGLSTYADNAAAITAGLTAGAFYIRTGHGLDVVV